MIPKEIKNLNKKNTIFNEKIADTRLIYTLCRQFKIIIFDITNNSCIRSEFTKQI